MIQPAAADNTWDGGTGVSPLWSTSANWGLDSLPTFPGALTFGGTTGLINTNDTAGRTISGLTFSSGAGQFVIGGNAFTLTGAINNNSGVTQTITPTTLVTSGSATNVGIIWSIAGSTVNNAIGGNGNVTFGSQVTSTVAGGPTFLFNNPLTSFNGGFGMTTGTGARTNTFGGTGNISITGLSNGAGTSTGNVFNWSNSGTLTLNGASVTGAINLNAGTTLLTGNYASNASLLGTFSVGSGIAPVTSATGINTGNATLRIVGTQNLGTAGIGNTTLVVRGGNTGGTPLGQGTLSLADTSINTLTVNNATASATLLTMAGTAGNSSILNLEIGNNSADQIVLGNNGKISVGAGGVALNITGIGGFNTGAATQSLTLVSAPGAGITAGGSQFTVGPYTGNFGGYTTASLSSTTTTALVLTLGGYTAAPTTGYWKGGVDGSWATLAGGLSNNSNWTTDSGGAADAHQVVGSASDVIFSASGPGTTTTTLGANFSIKSLTFNSDASISGNTLTVGNATTGITANTGATGTINSVLSGSSGVAKNGVGTVVLGGNNSYTGGLTLNDGVVRVANAGALNSTTPQALAFGNAGSTNPVLQLNGNSLAIGSLSATATANSPIVENANAAAATLTVAQSGNTNYAGVLRNGTGAGVLNFTKTGGGTLALGGANSYTGPTAVNNGTLLVNGNSSSANGAVSVAGGAILGGGGTVGGAATISSGGYLTGGDIGTIGTLTFSNAGGLTLDNGSISYFDIVNGGANDSISLAGGLMLSSGAVIRVSGGLTTATSYNLFSYTGADPSLSGVTFQNLSGNALGSNYTFTSSGGVLSLTINSASQAIPGVNITLSTTNRLMQGTAIGVSGVVDNSGPVALNGTLSDSGGNLTIGGFTPSSPFTVAASGGTQAYTGSTNSGATLGNRTLGVTVSDPAASPTAVTASTSVSVLQNRVVSASTVTSFGSVHQGAALSGTTSLTSTGADDSNTRVTVGNSGADANGISVTGGTGPTFNGSTSDTRTVSGNISTLGTVNGAITLNTTGEAGISGTQTPVNVTVNYSASVYSGKAAWTAGAGGNWVTGGNWADTQGGGVAGSPGVDGALSAGDTATFGDVSGSPVSLTVSLNGTSPSLNGITFNSTATAYTIAPGSGGSINLQGAATPVDVSTTFSPTISAGLSGSGLSKTGTGTLILSGTSNYAGTTAVTNGTIQLTGGNDRLPTATAVTLGSGANSGKLVLGDVTTARNQTLAGLTTSGSGTANNVVGAAAANSILTVNLAAGSSTYAGSLGGASTNENNLSLTKSGAGTLVLTGNNTYTGGTTLSGGSLNMGSANAIGTTGTITFAGGSLQFSAANTTDYSSRFATTGNNAYNLDTNGQNVTIGNPLAASGTSGLTKTGAGTLTLAAGNAYTGATIINAGLLVTPDAGTNTVRVAGGVWQPLLTGNATITGTLGTSTGAGALNAWSAGGFAANGGKLTVTVNGGADLTYQVGGFLGSGLTPMIFGSAAANNQVEVTNNINMNTGDAFQRVIVVNAGTGGDSALLSGVLSGGAGPASATGIVKQGSGTLILSGNNTYTGLTTITAGTVVAGQSSLSGSSGAFGTGTGASAAPTAPSAILLDAFTGASPTLLIGGAFEVGRAVTINNTATTGTYGIGGSTDNSATFSGLITTSQNFKVTQVATTGGNVLNITGGIAAGAGSPIVNFNNTGAVHVSNAAISGNLTVIQSGSGSTTFSAANTYTGTTTISGGTLALSGSGGIAASPNIIVGAATTFDVSGVTGGYTLAASQTLSGTGTVVGAASIAGTLSPGNSPGALSTGSQTWLNGGDYNWQIANAAGTMGVDYDTIALTGSLDLSSLTAAAFSINLWSLSSTGPDVNGIAANFNNTTNYSWTLLSTTAGITGFDAADFAIHTGAFNGTGGFTNAPGDGTFSLAQSGNNLVLNFSVVPEPSTALIGGLTALTLLRRRRTV